MRRVKPSSYNLRKETCFKPKINTMRFTFLHFLLDVKFLTLTCNQRCVFLSFDEIIILMMMMMMMMMIIMLMMKMMMMGSTMLLMLPMIMMMMMVVEMKRVLKVLVTMLKFTTRLHKESCNVLSSIKFLQFNNIRLQTLN